MYNSSIKRSKCAATTVCMATGIVYVVCFYIHGLEELFTTYVYGRVIFHLRMCDYLFTKILCTYLLFVHTWGVYVHMYLFSLFVLMDLVHQFLIIIIFSFSILIDQHLCFQQDSRSTGSSETLIFSCNTSATWCSRAETEAPMSNLLALNQSGENLALSQCVNF